MADEQGKYYPSPSIIFRYQDEHPFVAIKGKEIQVPISTELHGIDLLSLLGKQGMMLRVAQDQASFELRNGVDGGTF